jgi:imidazolonepropionase-like amidohydrolase
MCCGIAAAVCLAFSIAVGATPSQASQNDGAFVIRNVRVFDGVKIIEADSVAVADGKIVAVGTNVTSLSDAQVIDGSGDTLLPGLIDSHVHAWLREVLETGLVMGVTTQLDMFMRWQQAEEWHQEGAKGALDIADFRTAGTAIAVAGGHGMASLPTMKPIRSADEAQAFVDERIAQGSDYIKVIYNDAPWFAAMPEDVMVAIVKAAHRRGKLVVVHVYSAQGILDVIDAGADGLAHVPIVKLPEPAFRDAVKAHQPFAMTTLGYTDFFFGSQRLWSTLPEDPLIAPYLAPLARRSLERSGFNNREHISYADNEAALRTLHAIGTPILAGTDAADLLPAGALLHTELELMVKAGLTPSETLADATSVPARIFSLRDRGRIAPGMRADLLLVRGDPTKDIQVTRDIVAIWKQGVRVDRESYRDAVAQKNEAWRFGAGWMPDTDSIFKGTSKVRLRVVDGGPDHASSTMILACDVKPGIKYPFAGALYIPALSLRKSGPVDLSGSKDITFWSRGDGKTYSVAMFTKTEGARPVLRPFLSGKDWQKHTIPISEFHTDGHDITLLSIVATEPGKYDFQLSGFRFEPAAATHLSRSGSKNP